MIIGIPKEIKESEHRVGMTPSGVQTLIQNGHDVYVQNSAGQGSGHSDEDYSNVGAKLIETIEEVYEPFLIQQGFIVRTPRGRQVTDKAYNHLGRNKTNQNNLFN